MWWSHDRKECFLRQSRRSKSFQRKGPSRPRLAIHDHSLTFSNIGNRVQMSISVETLTSADLRAVEFGEALLAHFRRLFRSRVSRVSLESLSRVFQKVLDLFKRAAEFQKYSRARVLRRLSSTHVSDIYRTPSRLASRTSLSTPLTVKKPHKFQTRRQRCASRFFKASSGKLRWRAFWFGSRSASCLSGVWNHHTRRSIALASASNRSASDGL